MKNMTLLEHERSEISEDDDDGVRVVLAKVESLLAR